MSVSAPSLVVLPDVVDSDRLLDQLRIRGVTFHLVGRAAWQSSTDVRGALSAQFITDWSSEGIVRAVAAIDADPDSLTLVAMGESSVRLIGDAVAGAGCRGLSPRAATLFTDKLTMLERAAGLGVEIPQSWLASSGEWTAYDDVDEWVLKPRRGTQSVGVERFGSRDDLASRVRGLHDPGEYLVQEYVAGQMYFANAVVVDGSTTMFCIGTYLHSVMETGKRPRTFLKMWLTVEPESAPPRLFDDLHRRHDRLREGFGLETGWTHMEFIRGEAGRLVFCEAAARPAGVRIRNMERHLLGVTNLEVFARSLVGDWPPPDVPRHPVVGQIDFTAEGPVKHYSSVTALAQEWILEARDWPVEEVLGGAYTSPLARVALRARDTTECELRLEELSDWFDYVPLEDAPTLREG